MASEAPHGRAVVMRKAPGAVIFVCHQQVELNRLGESLWPYGFFTHLYWFPVSLLYFRCCWFILVSIMFIFSANAEVQVFHTRNLEAEGLYQR